MLRVFICFTLAVTALQTAAQNNADPRALVRAVTRAVEGDSAARLRIRYAARVARHPNERAALLALASLARLQYDYPAAESAYRRLLSGAPDRYSVYARLGLGEGLEERSMSRAARMQFEQAKIAAHQLGDRIAEGQAQLLLAFIRGRLEGVAVAEVMLDSAASLIPDTAFDLWSRLRNRRAITYALRGRAADAVTEAAAGAALARRASDPHAEADSYRVLGQVLQHRGQWDSALVALRRSEELYLRARSRSAVATSLIWHAQVLGSLGRYGEMREVMRRALAEGEATHNPAAVADAQRAFGVLAQMLGDWPAATSHLKKSEAISAATGDSSGVDVTRKFLANVALMAGDIELARRLALERLAWAEKAEDLGQQYEAHRALAEIAAQQKDYAAAAQALAAARAQLRILPGTMYRAWLAHDDARLAMARGDLQSAERSLKAYLQMQSTTAADFTPFDARVRLADIYARRGELARAERELVTATDEIDHWRATLDDAELRTMAFQAAVSINAASSEPIGITPGFARVLAALAAGGRTESAFALAERWRARELIDQITRNAALRNGQTLADDTGASAASPRPRSASEIVAALPDPQTALFQFVATRGARITAFVVQRSGIQSRVLPVFDSLAENVARFDALLESGADAVLLAGTLGRALVNPLLPLLDRRVTRIIIVPDGPLHYLPFDALRLPDGRYLLERYALGYAPSASVLVELWARRATATRAPVRLLAFGNPSAPNTGSGAARAAGNSDYSAAPELTRLAGAAREARRVAHYADSATLRLGARASAAFLKEADLRPYRVLHFATHALVDEQSLAGSALVLAPSAGESGLVSAGDLAALRLNADLVVLSACRAARGVLVSGEGVQGLTSPLLQAGARALVATAWRINDQDAVSFVDAFYAAMASGLPVIDALRAAKLEALRRGESPRMWAAYLAIGDPLVTVPLRTPPRRWWSVIFRR